MDVQEVLAVNNLTTRDLDMPLSRRGNLRFMFVGYNFAGRLLEIGVEDLGEDKAHVFHGQAVSPQYRKLYEELITNE